MTLSAHQVAYLPWLGYFDKMARADVFVILDNVQYEKNSFINRNRVKVENKPRWLTVPLVHDTIKTMIKDKDIDNSYDWKKLHINTLQSYYGKAPFYKEHEQFIRGYINTCGEGVSERWITEWLTLFPCKNCYIQSRMGIEGDKLSLPVNLCKYFGANEFLFGDEGWNTYAVPNMEYFLDNGITPLHQIYQTPKYPQMGKGDFIPNLSVVDALFNVGIDGVKKLLAL